MNTVKLLVYIHSNKNFNLSRSQSRDSAHFLRFILRVLYYSESCL